MSKKIKNVLILVVKYLLPAFVGWLEGDSHVVADSLSTFVNVLF